MKNLFILLVFSLSYCSAPQKEIKKEQTPTIEYKIFKETTGWGYDIIIDKKTIIHQTVIPAIPTGEGFSSAEKAEKTAKLVVEKLQKNIVPPTLSVEELDSLDVL